MKLQVVLMVSGGAEVVGALRTTLLFGPSMVNKFRDPDTITPTNAADYLMIFLFFYFKIMIILDFKNILWVFCW